MFDRYISLDNALQAVYPEFAWQPSRFNAGGKLRKGFWQSVANQRDFLDKLGKELGINQVDSLPCMDENH